MLNKKYHNEICECCSTKLVEVYSPESYNPVMRCRLCKEDSKLKELKSVDEVLQIAHSVHFVKDLQDSIDGREAVDYAQTYASRMAHNENESDFKRDRIRAGYNTPPTRSFVKQIFLEHGYSEEQFEELSKQ